MTLKTETLQALGSKIVFALATAGTIGAGGAIVSSATTNAVQDSRIARVEQTVEKIDELNTNLQETSTEVALLRQELEASRDASD